MKINDYGKILIGLTGNIASGKSIAMRFFDDEYFLKIDSDEVASEHLEDREVVESLKNRFGDEILDSSNKIDRKRLSRIAFSDRGVMKTLEGIIHPFVFADIEEMLKSSNKRFAIIESAILFENGLQGLFKRVITVFAPKEVRIKRLMERAGIEYEEAARKIDFQMGEFLKISKSDYVIDNSMGLVWLRVQVKRVEEDIMRLIYLN